MKDEGKGKARRISWTYCMYVGKSKKCIRCQLGRRIFFEVLSTNPFSQRFFDVPTGVRRSDAQFAVAGGSIACSHYIANPFTFQYSCLAHVTIPKRRNLE
jgi:hypothetical protein